MTDSMKMRSCERAPTPASRECVALTSQRLQSSEMTPGVGFRVKTNIERPCQKLTDSFKEFETADISDLLNRLSTMSNKIQNLSNDLPVVGPAITVKLFPGDNLLLHKALDVAQPGDVIVVDTTGSNRNAVFGDMIANKAKHIGVAGLIIDGLIRDLDGVKETGLPVYARGVTPFGPLHRGPGELNYTISCGGVVVEPGDIIAADTSGVVVVRRDIADDISTRLSNHKEKSAQYVREVKRGSFNNDWVDAQLLRDGCLFE